MLSHISYLYAGIGLLNYESDVTPPLLNHEIGRTGWTGVVPYGLGFEFKLSNRLSFDINGGSNFTFCDNIDPIKVKNNDSYAGFLAGIRISSGGVEKDSDGDGLLDKLEKTLGTDPKKADTDGDGLSDGEEYNQYKTDPLKGDTDGDGLKDGDEVKTHHTNALVADTDNDGLNDKAELFQYKTDPIKADTDGDGLNDGMEVKTNKTDPILTDTDKDGLSDGEEITKYHTDPLLADTDKGTINDGVEVKRGTNPLDPSDDIPKPKKEVFEIKEQKKIVLEGITFKTASAEILPESETVLTKALNTLEENPNIRVEVQGYTDNKGNRAYNMKLSQSRAESIRNWFIGHGINADRLTAKGYGPDNPVATNDTEEGRKTNRRIEFEVLK